MAATFAPLETNVAVLRMNGLTSVELCRVDVMSTGAVTSAVLPELWTEAISDNVKKLMPYTSVSDRYNEPYARLLVEVAQADGTYTARLVPTRDYDTLELVLTVAAETATDAILLQIPKTAEAGFNINGPDASAAGVVDTVARDQIASLATALSGKASATHNHDAIYAFKDHTHTGYAPASLTVDVTTLQGKVATLEAAGSGSVTAAQLALKADKTYVDATFALTGHTHTEYAPATLATTVTSLEGRLTTLEASGSSSVTAADLALKADKTYVDTTFALAGHSHDYSALYAPASLSATVTTLSAAVTTLETDVAALKLASGGSGGTIDPALLASLATKTYVDLADATLNTRIDGILTGPSSLEARLANVENMALLDGFFSGGTYLVPGSGTPTATPYTGFSLFRRVKDLEDTVAAGGGGSSVDLSSYATKTYVATELLRYAETTHVHASYALAADLTALTARVTTLETSGSGGGSGYATETYVTTQLGGYYTKLEVDNDFATKAALTTLQAQVDAISTTPGTSADVLSRLTALETLTANLTGTTVPTDYVTTSGLATLLTNYPTFDSLGNYLTEAELLGYNYVTGDQLAAALAAFGDGSSIGTPVGGTGYVTQTDLNAAGYIRLADTKLGADGSPMQLVVEDDLVGFADNTRFDDYYTKQQVDDGFATRGEISSFVTAATVAAGYYPKTQTYTKAEVYTKTEVDTKIAAIPSGGGGGSGTSVSRVKKTFTVGTATAGYQYVTIYAIGGTTALDAVTVTRHDLTWAATPPTLSATTYATGVVDAPATLTNGAILRISNTSGIAIDRVVVTQYTTTLSKPNLVVVMDNPAGTVVAHEAQRPSAIFHGTSGGPTVSGINVLYVDQYGQGFATVTPTTTYPTVRVAYTAFSSGSSNIPQNLIITL